MNSIENLISIEETDLEVFFEKLEKSLSVLKGSTLFPKMVMCRSIMVEKVNLFDFPGQPVYMFAFRYKELKEDDEWQPL